MSFQEIVFYTDSYIYLSMLVYKGVYICNECFSKLRNLNIHFCTILYNDHCCTHFNRLFSNAFYHLFIILFIISGGLFLNFLIGTLLDFPAKTLAMVLVLKKGRKYPYMIGSAVTGIDAIF